MEDDEHEPPRRRPLSDFFSVDELSQFGQLADKVFVVFDKSMPPSLHGMSEVEDGVPIAKVNPRAADHRYVILHELMHHKLDEMGCPSLWVTVRGSTPEESWLSPTCFPVFARGPLVCACFAFLTLHTCSPVGLFAMSTSQSQSSTRRPVLSDAAIMRDD